MNRKELQKELKELSPILADLQVGDKPDIPEGYFANLENRVLSRIREKNKQESKVFYLTPRFLYAVAASISVILVVSIAFLTMRQDNMSGQFMDLVQGTSTLDYILDHPYEIDEEFLFESELLEDIDLGPIEIAESENIEAYLNENIQEFELSYFDE